jgi:hypothetical protein
MTPTEPLTRVVLNTQTGEFFEAEDAVLVESEFSLNLDFIRESGQDIRSFGNVTALASSPAPAGLDVERLAKAISLHHRRSYIDMLDRLAAESITKKYARAATRPAGRGFPGSSRRDEDSPQSSTPSAAAPDASSHRPGVEGQRGVR